MGCCISRLKDDKEKSGIGNENGNHQGNERTIKDFINKNNKKRNLTFLEITNRHRNLQNSNLM